MNNKSSIYLLISIFLLLSSVQIANSQDDMSWWDSSWSYREKIFIPIDTTNELAKNQPFDTRIVFNNPCWVKNEIEHSIRVIYQKNGDFEEIESQIYDINFSSDNNVESCSLVFLIPDYASGNEEYYLYYDSQEKKSSNYKDRVKIEDSYYSYEPIQGYPFESNYYKIIQNDFIVYAIAQSGKFLGSGVAQQVTKLKPESENVMPKNGELFASFDFLYFYGSELDESSGSMENIILKEILIDGNLMVKCRVVSESSRKDIRTNVVYTYYYCPTVTKRIYSHVKHETLKEFTVVTEPEVEGSIASLQCGGLESNSIQDLNFGRIYPYLHIYTEEEKIEEYKLDLDPTEQSGPGKWSNTIIIGAEDDVDLGKKAWVSYDDGEAGIAHALILGSNSVISQGKEERDGVQIKLREQDSTDLPGLESNMAFVQFSRNIYESDKERDLDVPDDLIVEYDAEFFSTSTRGYKGVDEESEIFQTLVKNRPSEMEKVAEDMEIPKDCSLTVNLHISPSIPFGSALSILSGRNLSYINAELYFDNNILSTEVAGRISTKPLTNIEEARIMQKIKLALSIFDWENLSLFKRVQFHNLESGRYLIKIYKENPVLGKERKFIGFKAIDVQEDTSTHIICRPERHVNIYVSDQNGEGFENVEAILVKNEDIIVKTTTDTNGSSTIKAPCSILGDYTLRIQYSGFTIYDEPIKLGFTRKIIPIKKNIEVNLHELQLEILDSWKLSPDFEIEAFLTSEEMDTLTEITPEKQSASNYHFSNLLPAKYKLRLQYKSFKNEIEFNIPEENKISLTFPAEFVIKTHVFDSRGIKLKNIEIFFSRGGKTHQEKSDNQGFSQTSLPPGTYDVNIYKEENLIGKRKINLMGNRNYEFITTEEPIFPLYIISLTSIFALFFGIFFLRKREVISFLKILAIAIAIISIISPWWVIENSSSNSEIESATKLFLIPPEMTTITSTPSVIAGERAVIPEILVNVLTLLSISIAIGCVLIIINMVFKRFNKHKLSLIFLSLGSISFIGILSVFYYAMSELAKVGIGSIFGEGPLSISILGEGIRTTIQSKWGPSIGFYLCLISLILLIACLIFTIRKFFRNKTIKQLFERKNFIKNLKRFLPLIGILILVYLIYNIGTDEIISTFLKISPIYVILAAFLTIPRIIIRNIAWQRILKLQKINLKFFQSLKIFLIGYFYGSVTPAYMGQIMRIPYIKEKTNQPVGKLFVNSFVETAVHTLSLYGMIVIGAILVIDQIPEALPIALALLILTLLIYGLFLKEERGVRIFYFFINLLIPKKLKSVFKKFVDTFYIDFPNVKKLIIPFLLGIPTWIIIYTQIYILGLSLDIEVPYLVFLMLYPIANIVAFIPVTSAGLGTREATLVFLFSFFGVSPEKAIVISLAGHLLTDVLTGFYGFIISIFEVKNKEKDILDLNNIIDN